MAETWTFTLDGATVEVLAEPKTPVLDVLREQLGVCGAKGGCAPQALCGCCTVLVDGRPRVSCTLPTKSVAGKQLTTLTGVRREVRDALADGFLRAGAVQCGYCTPGIALSAAALLEAEPSPGPELVSRALQPHVCRCTGYVSIVRGVLAAAALLRGEDPGLPPRSRPEGAAIVLGERAYVEDLVRPGLRHGALVLAPVARGVVEAVEVPEGVSAVILRPVGAEVEHAGVVIAAVVAEDPVRAATDAASVVVRLGPPLPPREAVVARGRRLDGDVEAALAASAHRVEGEWTTASSDPVFLEPEAVLAIPTGDGVVVYSPGHDAHAEAAAASAALGVPVRVRLVPSGGSYGGKEGLPLPEIAARLALLSGAPVRLAVAHEVGMRLHRRRPAARVRVRAGCGAGGDGLVIDVRASFDGGADCAGADRVVAAALGAVPYTAVLGVEAEVVSSDSAATGPIRGAGSLAVVFAVERALDDLARAAGLDPWWLRSRAVEGEAARVLESLAEAWAEAAPGESGDARGVALARADGAGGARVVATREAGGVEVQCNVPDLGQGRDEALAAVFGENVTIAWAEGEKVGTGASASAPVLRAARAAQAKLARARRGQSVVGEDRERGDAGWSGAVVSVRGGVVAAVTVAAGVGEQDAFLAERLAEGAAHMGVGVALSEEVVHADGLCDGRFRVLGVLKEKHTPPLVARTVALGGSARDVSETAVAAVPAALANAVTAAEGPQSALPMKTSAAARGVGVKVR